MIIHFESKDCAKANTQKCFRMTARYGSPGIITQTFEGDRISLSGDLAALVMKGSINQAGKIWSDGNTRRDSVAIPPFLFTVDLPENMAGLINTANGLSKLKIGCPNHGNGNITRDDCLRAAKQELLAVDSNRENSSEPRSSAAALGLALIALDAAMSDARQGSPTL